MVSPLLWALAVMQPFWSLGPFEDHWQIVSYLRDSARMKAPR